MLPYGTDNILRLRFMGTTNGEQFQLVQHFRVKFPLITFVDFQNAVTQDFLAELRALMCTTTRFTSVGHARVRPQDGDEEQETAISPIVGLRDVHSMPNQIAHLIKLRTDVDAPSGRGRLYLPGMPQDHFSDGGYNLLALAVQTSTCERLRDRMGKNGSNGFLEWGVASYQTDPLSFNPVTRVLFSSYPATMRTRRPTLT